MGGEHSKPGCFKIWVGSTQLGSIIQNTLGMDEESDCDCHPRGTCPDGEPSMPPLEEFMDMKLPNHIHCPTLEALPVLPQRHSWREYKRKSKWDWRKRQDGSPEAEQYRETVLGALDALPANKQRALQRSFGAAVRRLRSRDMGAASSNDTADHSHEVDPRLVLGLLLADPYQSARPVVESLPREMGNTLLRCAERAVNKTLERTSLQVPSEAQYGAYLQHVVDQWVMHTPAGLSRDHVGLLVAGGPYPNGSSMAGFAGDTDDAAINTMCDQVYRQAVANVEQQDGSQRYVASYTEMVASLEWERATGWDNSFLNAMSPPPTALGGLSWAENNLTAAFGSAFPALTVGMGFLTLSLYTGGGGQWA